MDNGHHAIKSISRILATYLPFVDGDPICCSEPLVALDVIDTVLQVAIAFGQVHLQQIPQQVF